MRFPMTSKERIMNTLNGKPTDSIPINPNWWGLYKFRSFGGFADAGGEARANSLYGKRLAEVDLAFYNRFKPDIVQLWPGRREADLFYREHCSPQQISRLQEQVKRLDSRSAIDEYVALHYPVAAQIREKAIYDHVSLIAETCGESAFIAMNKGNPYLHLVGPGMMFELAEGIHAMAHKTAMFEYLMARCYERALEHCRVLKQAGCDALMAAEYYCAADCLPPALYEGVMFPIQQSFCRGVAEAGLIPILQFAGDIAPLLHLLRDIGAQGLMPGESTPAFEVNLAGIRRKTEESLTLFGNLSSTAVLRHGSLQDVRRETLRQLENNDDGGFIMSSGNQLEWETPAKNIACLIETTRNYQAGERTILGACT